MPVRAVRVASIKGVEVRLDPSIALLAVLIAGLFTTRFLDRFGLTPALIMAVIGAALVVATTFLHELAHALEARHRGLEVESITLLLFGGVTEMHAEGQTARDELAIAAVGPWVSLVCGAAFGLISTYAPDVLPEAAADPVAELTGLLGWWNVLLAVFNIIPGAPLDGGRVLRALLWMLLGDRLRALRLSVRAGQGLGLLLVAGGLWLPIGGAVALVPALLGTLVLVTTGVFIANAAARELRQAELNRVLTGRTVADLMAGFPTPWPADRLVGDGRADLRETHGDLIAVDHPDGRTGMLEVADLGAGPGDGGQQTAGDLAEDITDLPCVEHTADLHTLVETFQGDHHVVRVVHDGRTVGALSEREVARTLERLRRTDRAPRRWTS